MQKPTPRPWISSNNSVWSYTLKENSKHGNTICVGTQNNFADMDHIVKCVNMHEELVEALKKIEACFVSRTYQGGYVEDQTIKNIASEALAKAEAEAIAGD